MNAKTIYLVLLNLGCAAGWAIVLFRVIDNYLAGNDVYPSTGSLVTLLQTVAYLEILNNALGLVKGSPASALMQVTGRNVVLFLCLNPYPEIYENWSVPMLFAVWAFAEIIRYPYYAFSLLKIMPYPLLWLRYTQFIIMYPLGFIAEVGVIYAAFPHIMAGHFLDVSMPNALNFAFHFGTFLVPYCILGYLIGAPSLYKYMLSQRRKALAPAKKGL
eukprot:TRINITY_DN2759_c0_g1::TRINITY_DN2759_c0_g1_i1::g.27403::m.27403 TRINITY_DN2759_c0_g1::TRINITY_DN2759_c0_g1_i1::g.27403  ORF type:complete len:231 (+),score=54.88,sp/Q8VZB2/HACD_ARATH/38.32/8e-39,PTPLA/PF04387.9/2.8e-49 TRINITY_DN2759_c0_g1_i1:46-693(+)